MEIQSWGYRVCKFYLSANVKCLLEYDGGKGNCNVGYVYWEMLYLWGIQHDCIEHVFEDDWNIFCCLYTYL